MIKHKETESIINELMELSYKFREMMFKLNPTILRSELTITQLIAIQYIYHNPSITLKDLSNKMVIAQSSASELIDRLVKMKYIERKIPADDRRKIILNVSNKGKKFIEQHIAENRAFFEKLLKHISIEEQKEYLQSMRKFYQISLNLVNQIDKEEK